MKTSSQLLTQLRSWSFFTLTSLAWQSGMVHSTMGLRVLHVFKQYWESLVVSHLVIIHVTYAVSRLLVFLHICVPIALPLCVMSHSVISFPKSHHLTRVLWYLLVLNWTLITLDVVFISLYFHCSVFHYSVTLVCMAMPSVGLWCTWTFEPLNLTRYLVTCDPLLWQQDHWYMVMAVS